MTVLILKPVLSIGTESVAEAIAGIELRLHASETQITTNNTEILKKIIREKTEAYILDKAEELGASVTVEVSVEMGKEYPYPFSAEIHGTVLPEAKLALTRYMEESLGIPAERQTYFP